MATASFNKRLALLEQAARPDDYSRKLSMLVDDAATDREIEHARRQYRAEVYRESQDPFNASFSG